MHADQEYFGVAAMEPANIERDGCCASTVDSCSWLFFTVVVVLPVSGLQTLFAEALRS